MLTIEENVKIVINTHSNGICDFGWTAVWALNITDTNHIICRPIPRYHYIIQFWTLLAPEDGALTKRRSKRLYMLSYTILLIMPITITMFIEFPNFFSVLPVSAHIFSFPVLPVFPVSINTPCSKFQFDWLCKISVWFSSIFENWSEMNIEKIPRNSRGISDGKFQGTGSPV